MEISNTGAAVVLMFVLTVIAVGASVWGNTTGGLSNEDVILMIENNTPASHSHPVGAVPEHEHEAEELASHSHNEYSVVAHNHNQYSIQSHSHTSSTGGSTGDFDLTLNKQNLELGDSFLLEGDGPREERYVAIMESPDEDQSQTGTTNVNGEFTIAFVIPDSWQHGTFSIDVFIAGEKDTITFNVDR